MDRTIARRWEGLVAWLDGWFDPEQEAGVNGFDATQSEIFGVLSAAWRAGEDKLSALESTSERLGREPVRAVVRKLCARHTSEYWAGLTAREGRTLDDLLRLLWEPLPAQGFEFTIDRDETGARFDCRRCPMQDLAADLEAAGYAHARDWMYELVCSTDFHVTATFDPPIRFSRTQTLMQGHPHCDHTYTFEAPA